MNDAFFLAVAAATAGLLALALLLFASTLWLHRRTDAKAARSRRLSGLWEQFLLDHLAGEGMAEALWSRVGPGDELDFLHYLWTYHRTLSGEEKVRVESLAAPYLDRLAPRLASRLPEIRARAVITLAALGLDRYERQVLAALDDPSDLVAVQAAGALARSGRAGHLPAILSHFDRYAGWSSGFLVSLLASMGAAALPALRALFADASRSGTERAFAGLALMELSDAEAAQTAAGICASERDPALLEAALAVLGRVGGPEHLDAARPHRLSANPRVRRQALQVIGHLGGEDVWAELRESLEDGSALVRAEAGRSLMKAGATEALEELARSRDRKGDLARQSLEDGT